jgi:hypothetical protein
MGLRSHLRRKRVVIPVATIFAVVVLFAVLGWTSILVPVQSGGIAEHGPDAAGL